MAPALTHRLCSAHPFPQRQQDLPGRLFEEAIDATDLKNLAPCRTKRRLRERNYNMGRTDSGTLPHCRTAFAAINWPSDCLQRRGLHLEREVVMIACSNARGIPAE